MHRYQSRIDPNTGARFLPVPLKGRELLNDPMLNKGTAFPRDERLELGI